MREPPAYLTDETIVARLRDEYGVAAAKVTFLPLGHDASAWVYRVRQAQGADLFLKVRLSMTNAPSLRIPRHLADVGVARALAPIPTRAGKLWGSAGDYVTILYPFVEGATGMERPMTDAQWIAYGAALGQIHAAPIPPDMARDMRREAFAPACVELFERVDAHIGGRTFDDPAGQELAAFWQARRGELRALLDRSVALGRRLAAAGLPLVICHADIHTGNVLVDEAGEVWIVDWDETMLAPRERDLMFVVGGISAKLVGPREEALFFQGYGAFEPSPLALAYYRYNWAVQDISEYAAQVLLRDDFGEHTRREGLRGFLMLFEPGEIVSLALGSHV